MRVVRCSNCGLEVSDGPVGTGFCHYCGASTFWWDIHCPYRELAQKVERFLIRRGYAADLGRVVQELARGRRVRLGGELVGLSEVEEEN